MATEVIERGTRSMATLLQSLPGLQPDEAWEHTLKAACSRGHFTPSEDEQLFDWLARFLTVRTALLETIASIEQWLGGMPEKCSKPDEWRCFMVGYAAACILVRLDRWMLEVVAQDSLVQRKINEGHQLHRIPRKQYTAIFKSMADLGNAWRMYQAMKFGEKHAAELDELKQDPLVGFLVEQRRELTSFLDPSKRNYLKRLFYYRDHSWRRRGASGLQQSTFAVLEVGGRALSELNPGWMEKRVNQQKRDELEDLLKPGDVLVTRHQYALTNLVLPGFWPHAALYIGSGEDREALGVEVEAGIAEHWSGSIRTLEALKDGVRLRPLSETLAVDSVAIIRPEMSGSEITIALARALQHEGKGYNFDFDFFRADRLVCTEVIYRGFDGIGSMKIPLNERAGRPTLSAQDLLDLALKGKHYRVVALFGIDKNENQVLKGKDAENALRHSYQ
ncbi:MAG: hypothetical protein GY814_16760 [Gammaproteobacteria bacterium]|nr:hypothetical protein [Gammaproteobacteria bacterium]